jgi:hypothetical protein
MKFKFNRIRTNIMVDITKIEKQMHDFYKSHKYIDEKLNRLSKSDDARLALYFRYLEYKKRK